MKESEKQETSSFRPYIPADQILPEFTLKSVVFGTILGLIFSAVTVYLGLKAGLTVAVNIPIAIVGMAFFAFTAGLGLSRRASILEINTVQTTGAAGESIAAGVIFTLPALLFMGFALDISRIFVVSLAGGLLGVCFLIPLRRYLIEKEHGVLPYPEGIACAEVIKSGEKGGASAAKVFWGAATGFVYKIAMGGLKFWKEIPFWNPKRYRGSTLMAEISPELLGVGFIIGPRTASIMVAGGFLSWMLLIPIILFFSENPALGGSGAASTGPIDYEFLKENIWKPYIRYIGAGAVAAGGFINLARALPTIFRSFRDSVRDMKKSKLSREEGVSRISLDLPLSFVGVGIVIAFAVIFLLLTIVINPGHLVGNLVASLLIILFGFFFATVSSRLVGEIGVSSNPTSGMTIATLMATCIIFLAVGWKGGAYSAIALYIGAVVCICASNAGNVSQSLKSGYLLGCTPRLQEYGYVIGAFTSILIVGFTVLAVNSAFSERKAIAAEEFQLTGEYESVGKEEIEGKAFHAYIAQGKSERFLVSEDGKEVIVESPGVGSDKLPAPQARLMGTVIDGVLNHRLPWVLILMGICITIGVELCGVRGLPFAVGVYLPLSTSACIFIGGFLRWIVEKFLRRGKAKEEESSPGMLFSSGLIAGGAIAGLCIAGFAGLGWDKALETVGPSLLGSLSGKNLFAIIIFAILCAYLLWVAKGRKTGE